MPRHALAPHPIVTLAFLLLATTTTTTTTIADVTPLADPTRRPQDFFRPIVSPNSTEVSRDSGDGIAEFPTYDDMKLAIRKCDDTEFIKGHDKTGCFIRLYEQDKGGGGGGDRDRDRDRDRGRDRDRSRSVF